MPTATSPREPRLLLPRKHDDLHRFQRTTSADPDESWLKSDIQAWLDREQIDYPSSATKAELLALVTDPPPLDF